jgi:2-aminoethylphosphonate dioxygenase
MLGFFSVDLEEICTNSVIVDAISELFGEQAVLFKEKINFKLPGAGGFEPHQDQQAGWGVYDDLFINALISIDESTKENGALQIANTNYASDIKLIGSEWTPLTAEQIAAIEFETVCTQPGDVVFFDSYVPHKSDPNLSDKARRLMYLTYNAQRKGDFRKQYYADKRKSYPPDCEREQGKDYHYRV